MDRRDFLKAAAVEQSPWNTPSQARRQVVEIYGLIDPETHELRYIGKACDSRKRLLSHIRDARRRKTPVCSWVGSLAVRGLMPEVVVLEETGEAEWPARERYWIARGRDRGLRLLNLADGGDQPKQTRGQRAEAARAATRVRLSRIAGDERYKRIHNLKLWMGGGIAKFMREGNYADAYRWWFKARLYGAVAPEIGQWARALAARL